MVEAADRRVSEFLGGPRGRRFCAELVRERVGGPSAAVDVSAWSTVRDPVALLPALADAVGWARYWQEPDEVDTALLDGGLAGWLRPVAGAVLGSLAAAWWTAPLAREEQWQLRRWPDGPAPAPAPVSAGELVRGWRERVVAEEERAGRERPADPAAMVSGEWWSTPLSWQPPAPAQLVSTTPALPGTDGLPAGLVLVEDPPGADTVEARPVRVEPAARVYEVTGPSAWADLAATYPLDVTSSRRHDWFRATGLRGPWTIPDWAAVARDWDGVHLSVEGYLSTAGRPLRLPGAGGACTLLAGWDPGATWWLADVTRTGPPVLWTGQGGHPLGWRRRG